MDPKVAILTHFGNFQSGYALHVGWLERARMMNKFGVDFDFLVNEKTDRGWDESLPIKPILKNISIQTRYLYLSYLQHAQEINNHPV